MPLDADQIINELNDAGRAKLEELLMQCTNEQIDMFDRMYKSIVDIPDKKIPWAIRQVVNTINKNTQKVNNG